MEFPEERGREGRGRGDGSGYGHLRVEFGAKQRGKSILHFIFTVFGRELHWNEQEKVQEAMAPRREAEISLYTALVPIPALFPHLAKKPSTATAAELLQTGCTTALYERIWNEKHQPKLQSYRRKVLRKEKRPREGSQLEGGAQRPQKRKRTPVNPDSWKPPLPECANIPEIDLPNSWLHLLFFPLSIVLTRYRHL